MTGESTITVTVNGEERVIHSAPWVTLLEVLRDELSLTGAKRGCNQGVCGACTVLVNGRPVRGCLSLAVNSTTVAIETIEGLQHDPRLVQLQQAMIDTRAVQCGFCTPGVLLSAKALLDRNPAPSVDEIRVGLSGNLCRCSGYKKIVEAVRRVAEPPQT